MYPNLPTVELVLPPPIEGDSGLTAISLVDRPAIGVDFVLFNVGGKPVPKPLKLHFDAEKGIVTGPILIPNQPVYRAPTEQYKKGYCCYMTPETIQKSVQMFFAQGKTVSLNIMHDPLQRCSGFIFETWIKEHATVDKSELHFPGLPVGTAFISVQLTDSPTIERVKSGELAGFSMEGYFREIERQILLQQQAQPPTPKKQQMAQQKPTPKTPAKGTPAKGSRAQRWAKAFLNLFQEMEAAEEEMAAEQQVTAMDASGNEVSLTVDANGQVAVVLPDGSPAMLQLVVAENGEPPAEAGAAGEAEPGPGAGTEPVANPMDVAALRAEFKGQKMTESDKLMLMMAQEIIGLKEQLAEMNREPAGPPAKAAPPQKPMRQSFKQQGTPPKKDDFTAMVAERMEGLKEERINPNKGGGK